MNILSEDKILIIELGSYSIKVKVGTDDVGSLPNLEIRSQIGIPTSLLEFSEEKTTEFSNKTDSQTYVRTDYISDVDLKKAFTEGQLLIGSDLATYHSDIEKTLQIPIKLFDIQANGIIIDWLSLSFILIYLLVNELEITIADNDSAILVAVPLSWPKCDLEKLTQLCFETLNVPALYILPQPLATIYGYGVGNGIVVDMGYTSTKITPIVDSYILNVGYRSLSFGTKHLDSALLEYIQKDPTLSKALQALKIDLELIQYLREAGFLKFNPLQESDPEQESSELIKKVNNSDSPSSEPSPVTKIEYRGTSVEVETDLLDLGSVLFPPLCDVSFEKSDFGFDSPSMYARQLIESILSVINLFEFDKKQILWDNIVLSGGFSCSTGLGKRLEQTLQSYLPQSENSSTSQATSYKVTAMPEYFTKWRGNPHLATILGSTITAKIQNYTLPNWIIVIQAHLSSITKRVDSWKTKLVFAFSFFCQVGLRYLTS